MGKGRFFGQFAASALVVLAWWMASCGTANEQGISFRAIGFFADGDGDQGDLGTAVPVGCTDLVSTFAGLENNMFQGINVQRVDLSYRIPGGSLNLSNAAEPFAARLGPSSNQEANPPRAFGEIFVLNPQQMQFLNQNRNRLPELPFRLIALARGVGTADSGDVFITNEIIYPIDLLDDEACAPEDEGGDNPPGGSDEGEDTGGTTP